MDRGKRDKSGSFSVSQWSKISAFGLDIQKLIWANKWWGLAVPHYRKSAWFAGLCQESCWGQSLSCSIPSGMFWLFPAENCPSTGWRWVRLNGGRYLHLSLCIEWKNPFQETIPLTSLHETQGEFHIWQFIWAIWQIQKHEKGTWELAEVTKSHVWISYLAGENPSCRQKAPDH